MELKGKVDFKTSEEYVGSIKKGLVEKAHKELDVFKCVEYIKEMLLYGMYDEAVTMANILYHENNLDPLSEQRKDPKSRRITEIRYIIRYYKNNILK
jgi:hypothetical protein